jgi:hypothetical protein
MTLYIGVDPAFREGGFYVCVLNDNIADFQQMKTFIDFVEFIDKIADNNLEAFICIENSNETNHTFISPKIRSAPAREKISRDVGKNQAVSQMSVDYAKHRLKIGVYSVSPAEKGTKWDNRTMQFSLKESGYSVQNYKGLKGEQDKRDAYKLALRARLEAISYQKRKKF